MPEEDAKGYRFHPFDLTKVWSKQDYPLIEVGEFELNRNPENYFADVEQAAFTPANFVPGIGPSPDRMLQGRLFSYGDAARYRVGINHHQIPVNYPRGAKNVNTYHRDGQGRVDGNQGSVPGYTPNSYDRWEPQPEYAEPALAVMSPEQLEALFGNTARAIDGASEATVERHIHNCTQADPAYGEGVRNAIDALQAGTLSAAEPNPENVPA